MSEYLDTNRANIRWRLLSTVSALALLTSAYAAAEAEAANNDSDRPLIWIELGGQADHITGQGDPFTPAFLAGNVPDPSDPYLGFVPSSSYTYSTPNFSVLRQGPTPVQVQEPPKFSFGEEARVSYQPEDSDWVFSAAVRIGRSSNSREVNHQTYQLAHKYYKSGVPGYGAFHMNNFADTTVHHRERHSILDFTAGKDVGLGMFGLDGSSVLSGGVRFAQFTSDATFDIRARPDMQFKYQDMAAFGFPNVKLKLPFFQTNHATGQASRGFHGVGPSLSWNGSAPFAGNQQNGEIEFDWGVNAAVLFGRQRTRVHHHESEHYITPLSYRNYHTAYNNPVGGHSANRSVTVPNVGGFAGISFRKGGAKISFGYRADFFLHAMDAGIDTRKSETLGFKGPFASISVGLGD